MNDRRAMIAIGVLSALVFGTVAALFALPARHALPGWAAGLPRLNATLNGTCAVLLVLSRWAIARGRPAWHRRLNLACFFLSALFLVSYVLYHSFGVETRYPAGAPGRGFYLAVLASHILLAALVLPLVLVAFQRALTGQFAKHRRVVKWAYPVWLYVAVSGVAVYLMISPHYPFNRAKEAGAAGRERAGPGDARAAPP